MVRPTRSRGLRLFVAVYPPEPTAAALLTALRSLALPAHRLVPAGQMHLTLQFIGDTPASSLEDTVETVRRATGGIGGFDLAPRALIALPERGRKRLVAAETDAPAPLLELQRRLATRLSRRTRRDPTDRFRPHLTLCRFRAPTALPAITQEVRLAPFRCARISLMSSTLNPDGARHDEVAALEL